MSSREQWNLSISHHLETKSKSRNVKITLEDDHSFHVQFEDGQKFVIANNFHLADKIINQQVDGKEIILQLMGRDYSGHVTFQYMGTKYQLKIESILGQQLSKYMLPKKVIDTSSVIIAPMPGLVKSVSVTVGQRVSDGQELCVLEAMKMQNSMVAAKSGVIKAVHFKAGQTVSDDDVIIELQ